MGGLVLRSESLRIECVRLRPQVGVEVKASLGNGGGQVDREEGGRKRNTKNTERKEEEMKDKILKAEDKEHMTRLWLVDQ